MTQINYDGNGFYTINPVTKERESIATDSLPKEFNPGERVFFDYNDGIIFHKPVTRSQFVAECQRAYQKPVVYTKGDKLFSEKHLPVDVVCKENLPHPSKLVAQDVHPSKVDLTPVKSLDNL